MWNVIRSQLSKRPGFFVFLDGFTWKGWNVWHSLVVNVMPLESHVWSLLIDCFSAHSKKEIRIICTRISIKGGIYHQWRLFEMCLQKKALLVGHAHWGLGVLWTFGILKSKIYVFSRWNFKIGNLARVKHLTNFTFGFNYCFTIFIIQC